MPRGRDDAVNGPTLREVREGPAALALVHAYRWFVWSTRCRSALVDVTGGLEAGQHGMVALQARAAVEAGIDIYLATHGRFFVPEAHRWSILAEVCGEESTVYREAWRLECENPDTAETVSRYAERCRQFVEDGLGVSEPASRGTPEDLTKFEGALVDIATLAAFVGVESPLSGTRFEPSADARRERCGTPARTVNL